MSPAANQVVVEAIKSLIVLLTLSYTSMLDIKTREVEPRIWLYAGIPVGILTVYELVAVESGLREVLASAVASIILLAGIYVLYLQGLMGGGDLYAAALLCLAHPCPIRGILPPLIPILFYASIASALIALYFLSYNLIMHRDEVRRLRKCGFLCALYVAISGIPVKIRDYVESDSWFFPLEMPGEEGLVFRRSFDIEEEPSEHRRRLRELIEQGILEDDRYIWVAYGVPFLVPLLAGYIAYLLVGDSILVTLITRLSP